VNQILINYFQSLLSLVGIIRRHERNVRFIRHWRGTRAAGKRRQRKLIRFSPAVDSLYF